MSQPAVNITEIDGALGAAPTGKPYPAFVGTASGGTSAVDTPQAFGKTADVIAAHGTGPLVEAACRSIELTKLPAVCVRTGATTVGAPGTIDVTGVTGTSVVTLGATEPYDDYDLLFEVIVGGTIGVAGITFRISLDNGRTFGPITSLGTAVNYTISEANIQLLFAAGTLVADDIVRTRTGAPHWNAAELTSAMTALKLTLLDWRQVQVLGNLDDTLYDTLETAVVAMIAYGRDVTAYANVRGPNVSAETDAAYRTAMLSLLAAKAHTSLQVSAGDAKVTSVISGRSYRRPAMWAAMPLQMKVDEEENIAYPLLGKLVGVSLRDANGNPETGFHDETATPGLDDGRYMTLRSFSGPGSPQGVYVSRPRLFSPTGSDFELVPHRRVMNLAKSLLFGYFVVRLSKPVRVNASTGFILEEEALEIEAGANAALRGGLLAKPKASGGGFAKGKFFELSRTDNLLSTKTMTGQGRIVPLAYPEIINVPVGFYNPALQVEAV